MKCICKEHDTTTITSCKRYFMHLGYTIHECNVKQVYEYNLLHVITHNNKYK